MTIILNKTFHRYIVSLGILLVFSGQGLCAPPSLGLPIQCVLGSTCFIQNYFDNDPSPGYHDYTCGQLSYDGHTGTDFRLRDLAAMRTNVAVLAAASGIVVGVRDGEPDVSIKKRGQAAIKGKEAGNGVRMELGDGWSAQYSHMLRGSIRVHKGQRVNQGAILGFVGLSGNTEFPHVDFSVSKDGKPVDPFNFKQAKCDAKPEMLWSTTSLSTLKYRVTGLLISGFSTQTPDRDQAEDGRYSYSSFPVDAENLVYWAELFGLKKNDQLSFVLYGPDSKVMMKHEEVLPGNKAVLFSFAGKRRRAMPWKKGRYRALFRLVRNETIVIEDRHEITGT